MEKTLEYKCKIKKDKEGEPVINACDIYLDGRKIGEFRISADEEGLNLTIKGRELFERKLSGSVFDLVTK